MRTAWATRLIFYIFLLTFSSSFASFSSSPYPSSILHALSAPVSWERFLKAFFEKETLHVPGASRFLANAQLSLAEAWISELQNTTAFHENNFDLFARGGAVNVRDSKGTQLTLPTPTTWNRSLHQSQGMSVVYKRELLHHSSTSSSSSSSSLQRESSPSKIQSALADLFDTEVSAHAYVSAPGAQALQPHTDPYDVFVIHVSGQKRWRICVPAPAKRSSAMTTAELAELQEIERERVEGCTTYLPEDLDGMDCEDIEMGPGDLLYLPKGVVHYATTQQDATEDSAHITYGIKRLGQRWLDFATAICTYEMEEECMQLKDALARLVEAGSLHGLAWLRLATTVRTPSRKSRVSAMCSALDELVLSSTPELMEMSKGAAFSLSSTLSSFDTRQALLKQLGSLENCPQIYAKTQEAKTVKAAGGETSTGRLKRSFTSDGHTAWPPPCNTDDRCSCTSCDCDAHCDSGCTSSGTRCDASCDEGCSCDAGCLCGPGYIHYQAGVASVTDNILGRCSPCAAGKFSDTFTSYTSMCKDCPAGKFSGLGAASCTSCSPGKYQSSAGMATCVNSGAGFYVPNSGSSTRTACEPGSYSTASIATSCTPCPATPWPGSYQPSYGTTSCLTCSTGFYVDTVGQAACKRQPDLNVSVTPNSKSFILTVSNPGPRWKQYSVLLGKWRTDQYAQETMVGYPREYSSMDTTYVITLPKLIPGNWYYLYMEPKDKLASAYDATKNFTSELIQTTCGCIASDITGRPTSFTVTQDLGRIFFSWTDQSFCEDGFQIDRDGVTFSGEYAVVSAQECGRTHSPQSVFDIVTGENFRAGDTATYCVYAYARNKIAWSDSVDIGAYKSNQLCVQHRVLWEAKISGHVRLAEKAGKLPVEGVDVSFNFGDGMLTGATTTNSDGLFVILVKTNLLSARFVRLQVIVSKTSGEARTEHLFECDGVACTSRTVLIEQMTFANVMEFTDVSSLPVTGNVFIKGTEHVNFPAGCPLSGARVCALEHPHQTTIACVVSDGAGQYSLPVPTGISIYVTVAYSEHTLVRRDAPGQRAAAGHFAGKTLSGENIEYDFFSIDVDLEQNDPLDFLDTNSQKVIFQVAGGKCNHTMGTSTIRVTYDSCPSWSKSVVLHDNWNDQFVLPSHFLTAEVTNVTAKPPVRLEGKVPEYLTTMGTNTLPLNLTSSPQTLRWEYHPEPSFKLSFSAVGANDCNRIVIPRDTATTATVHVFEEFWGEVPQCSWVEGSVTLRSAIGEDAETTEALVQSGALDELSAKKLTACRETCTLSLETDEDADHPGTFFNARASIDLLSGEPETVGAVGGVEFAKFIEVGISATLYKIKEAVPVVVTGHKRISDKLSVAFPEYFPLLILYDPPGDSSYATYTNAESTIHLEHKSEVAFRGWYSNTAGGITTSWESVACSGLGVSFCTNIASVEGKALVAVEARGAKAPLNTRTNWDKTTTVTTTFTLETSENPSSAGDDLLVTPALNIVYSETADVSFNFTSCASAKKILTTWSLGANGQNTPMFTIKTYTDIKNSEIPELQDLLAAEEAKISDEVQSAGEEGRAVDEELVSEANAKIAKLRDAIRGWTATVSYIEDMRRRAGEGDLKAVTNLMSKRLTKDPKDILTQETVEGGQASLLAMSAISFTGGGHKYVYETESIQSKEETSGSITTYSVDSGIHFESEIISVVMGPYAELQNGAVVESEIEDLTTNSKESRSLYGFVLSDQDAGDQFDVKVFLDPTFGTFIFHTTSGSSMCPRERNTYAREQPRLRVISAPAASAFPWEEAVFKIQLINAAKEANHYRLYRLYTMEGEGGAVIVNGDTLDSRDFNFDIPPESLIEETLHVTRNDDKYAYSITLAFISSCEMDMGISDNADFIRLDATFLRECSGVEWAGSLAKEQTFLVNLNSGNALDVVAHNPQASSRKWAADDRLRVVKLEYRRTGELEWRWAQGPKGLINMTTLETPYGFASTTWNVQNLPDGSYDLRLSTACTPAGLNSPAGIDSQESVILSGRVDRSAPRTFSTPEPSDGMLSPGDSILAQFTEAIDCGLPFSFDVSVTLSGGSGGGVSGKTYAFGRSDVDILCSDRSIEISLAKSASTATLSGKSVRVVLRGVRDLALNTVREDVSWSFTCEKLSVEDTSVTIVDMQLTLPWNMSFADKASTAWASGSRLVAMSLSTSLEVSVARLEVVSFRESPSHQTYVTFKILPASTLSRRRSAGGTHDGLSAAELADLLAQMLRLSEDGGNGGNTNTTGTPMSLDPLLAGASVGTVQQASTTSKPQVAETSASSDENSVFTSYYAIITTLAVAVLIFGVLVFFVFRLHASNRELSAGLKAVMLTLKQQSTHFETMASMQATQQPQSHLARKGKTFQTTGFRELEDDENPYALAMTTRRGIQRSDSTFTTCEIPNLHDESDISGGGGGGGSETILEHDA